MYNLRYHIASLVAVFLALALGLVLGGLVVQRGTIGRQQDSLVAGLEQEFATLRDDNAILSAENDVLTAFADDMSTQWVADRLVGKNIIVLAGRGSRSDGPAAAAEAIESAGGNPVVITMQGGGLVPGDSVQGSSVPSDSASSAESLASVAASLAAEWTQPMRQRPITQALVDTEVLTVEGLEPGMVAYGVVNVASAGEESDAAGLALAQAFEARKAFAVVAEAISLDSGHAQTAAARGLSAFDTLGSAIGRYTLVSLATGGKAGYYGLGEEAVAPYPEPPAD